MTSDDVKAKVDREIADWRAPVGDETVGAPWDAERYASHLAALRASLVQPYLQRFHLLETFEQLDLQPPREATYWVVGASGDTIVWYDEAADEFELARWASGALLPESIGVRGDLVGVFSAR